MAFTFVVEDGTNVSQANSYVAVAFADDYFDMNFRSAVVWTPLTTEEKERLLALATQYVDTNTNWRGDKTYVDSALRWPRRGMYDADGNAISTTYIPVELKKAVCEVALYFLKEDVENLYTQNQIKELKVDAVEVVFDPNRPRSTFSTTVKSLIRPFGVLATGGAGSKFYPISK